MDGTGRGIAVLSRIRIVEQSHSTNSELLTDTAAVEGDWLVALEQTAGRGRQGRAWQAAKGNFTGSTLVVIRDGDPPPQILSLAAGLALIEAVDLGEPGQALMLKWPNDLLLMGRKLAGILLERSGDRIVIGFGVNLAAAPNLEDRQAARLSGRLTPQSFAPLLAGSFARLLDLWRSSPPMLLGQAWLARAHPIGTALTVHSGAGEQVSGRFDGIEPDGGLRLRMGDGALEIVRAGDTAIG